MKRTQFFNQIRKMAEWGSEDSEEILKMAKWASETGLLKKAPEPKNKSSFAWKYGNRMQGGNELCGEKSFWRGKY